MAAVPRPIKPPAEPIERDGQISTAWQAFFQAVADRLAEAEARLAALEP